MKLAPDPQSDELLALAMAIADGRAISATDPLAASIDPALRANVERLAALAVALRQRGDAAPTPDRWGHLDIGEALGSGSFGRVFRAWDSVLQREVALKLRRGDAPGMDAFGYIEEARRLARVRHPNVLAVHGADVHDGEVGLWSDLINGETLEAMLAREGALPWTRVWPVAEQLAEALAAVHAAGLVHGDVKAANVMLDEQGTAILMDFGAGTDAIGCASPGIGSPLAMAPERLEGHAPSAAADCYAFGVLVFRLLSGHYPVDASDLADLRTRHRDAHAPDWKLLPHRLPRSARRLLEHALVRDPRHRPSATAIIERLRWLRAAPLRRRRYAAIAAVLVALSLGMVAAGVGYLEARRETARVEQVKAFVVSLFDRADVFGSENEGDLTAAALLRSGAAKLGDELAGQPRAQAELLVIIGGGLLRLQDMNAARSANSQALELIQRMRDPDPRLHARALSNLGIIDSHDGQPDRARGYFERALATLDSAGLAQVDVRFSARTGLARLASERGDHERALAMREILLAERIAAFGPRDPAVAMDNYNLAATYMRLDRYVDAERAYRRCESILVDTLGAGHLRLLLVEAGMGVALRQQGRFKEAEQHARNAVEGWEAQRMTDSPHYAHALEVLASILLVRHQPGAACGYMQRALSIAGIRRADRGWLHAMHGDCLAAQGQWRAAETAYADSEAILVELTEDLPRIHLLRARGWLAAWRDRAEPVARAMVESTLRGIEHAGAGDQQYWMLAASTFGRILREQGEPEAALPLLERARDRSVALGYFGAIGRAAAEAEIALTHAALPHAGTAERARLDSAAAALAAVDPANPLHEQLMVARAALDEAPAQDSPPP